MKIYHGSTFIVKNIDLKILNNKTDFGQGFYTTTDIEQSKKWSLIKLNRLKEKTNDTNAYINVYDYTENENLKILSFDSSTEEWLDFIYKNRQSETLIHDYDIVKGPVANDNLYQVLSLYEDGTLNKEETIIRLKTYLLSNQISFHTNESLKCIKYIETIKVGEKHE